MLSKAIIKHTHTHMEKVIQADDNEKHTAKNIV